MIPRKLPTSETRSKPPSFGHRAGQRHRTQLVERQGGQEWKHDHLGESTEGRSVCSCEACRTLSLAGFPNSSNSSNSSNSGSSSLSELEDRPQCIGGYSSSSGGAAEGVDQYVWELHEGFNMGTPTQTIQRLAECPSFGYGAFRSRRAESGSEPLANEPLETMRDLSIHDAASHDTQKLPSMKHRAGDVSSVTVPSTNAKFAVAGHSDAPKIFSSPEAEARLLPCSSYADSATTGSSSLHEGLVQLDVVDYRMRIVSKQISSSMPVCETGQLSTSRTGSRNTAVLGRLWSVASLGVNRPNEDRWHVERQRLMCDFQSYAPFKLSQASLRSEAGTCSIAALKSVKCSGSAVGFTRPATPPGSHDVAECEVADCDSGFESDDSFTVGLFDGHEGATCCELVGELLLETIRDRCTKNGKYTTMLQELGIEGFARCLIETFEFVDKKILELLWEHLERSGDGHFAITGACCITATLMNGGRDLFVASLGDCEAYLGRRCCAAAELPHPQEGANKRMARKNFEAIRLCRSHNLRISENSKALMERFPNDPSVVQKIGNNFFVKGKLQVSHAFGNGYLKEQRFNERLYPIFRAKSPYCGGYVSATPHVEHVSLMDRDEFLILGTDGFWENAEPEVVVELLGHFFHDREILEGNLDQISIDPRRASELLMQYVWLRLHDSIEPASFRPAGQTGGKSSGSCAAESRPQLRDDCSVLVLFLRPTEIGDAEEAISYTGNMDCTDFCEQLDGDTKERIQRLRASISEWMRTYGEHSDEI